MKFTDGFWQLRPGVTALYAQEAYDIWQTDATATSPARHHGADHRHRQARRHAQPADAHGDRCPRPLEGVVARARRASHRRRRGTAGSSCPAPSRAARARSSVDDDGRQSSPPAR